MPDNPKVDGYNWRRDLKELNQATRIIVEKLEAIRRVGGLTNQANRYVADIAIQVARQQAAISDLRDIASYSENGKE